MSVRVSKIIKYIAMVIGAGIMLLGFGRICPMEIAIPISIAAFFVGVAAEFCEMYFKKNKTKLSTVLYLIRFGLIVFCCIIIVIVLIRRFVFGY